MIPSSFQPKNIFATIAIFHLFCICSSRMSENATFSLFGCSFPEVQTKLCACFQNSARIDEDICPLSLSNFLQEECGPFINTTYSLQHRRTADELEIYLNLNSTSDITITMVSGNCSFDCSGKAASPCELALNSFNCSANDGRFYLKKIKPGNYCFRMKILGHELCILYTKLYTFEMNNSNGKAIYLGENNSLLCLILITCILSGIFISIYIYKVKSKAVTLLRNDVV